MKMIKRQESEASRKLFVAGLDVTSMEGDLGEYFKKFGKVSDVKIVKDHQTQISKRFGFVTFSTSCECTAALGDGPHVVNSKKIIVQKYFEKDQKPIQRPATAAATPTSITLNNGNKDVVFSGLSPSRQGISPSLLNRRLPSGQISFEKSLPSSGYISTGSGSKNHDSNPQARNEGSSKIADDDTFINFNKCERITNLVAHCPYEFYFKKNNLKPEEQRAIDQFHLSSPKRLLLDYCKKGNYIAVKLMCGRWRRALFVRKVVDSYVKVFYLDYGYADEDVMEDQVYMLPEESIKYPPIQAQKLVIEGLETIVSGQPLSADILTKALVSNAIDSFVIVDKKEGYTWKGDIVLRLPKQAIAGLSSVLRYPDRIREFVRIKSTLIREGYVPDLSDSEFTSFSTSENTNFEKSSNSANESGQPLDLRVLINRQKEKEMSLLRNANRPGSAQ